MSNNKRDFCHYFFMISKLIHGIIRSFVIIYMRYPKEKPSRQEDTLERAKTWDGSTSAKLMSLRARCAADTMKLKRSTIRIPLTHEDVEEMSSADFGQYIESTIETARLLVLEVLEGIENSKVYIVEWSAELECDRQNPDIPAIRSHILERIKCIDTLNFLIRTTESTEDVAYAKSLLQEALEKLDQRRKYLLSRSKPRPF